MPELPEVETIRTSLARLVVGKQIVASTVYDSPKSFPNDPAAVAHFLHGGVWQPWATAVPTSYPTA